MNRGEKLQLIGVGGMIISALCLDSDFLIPAAILFLAFSILVFSCHFLMNEGFIDSDDLTKIDKKKIAKNREEVFRNWVKSGRIK